MTSPRMVGFLALSIACLPGPSPAIPLATPTTSAAPYPVAPAVTGSGTVAVELPIDASSMYAFVELLYDEEWIYVETVFTPSFELHDIPAGEVELVVTDAGWETSSTYTSYGYYYDGYAVSDCHGSASGELVDGEVLLLEPALSCYAISY